MSSEGTLGVGREGEVGSLSSSSSLSLGVGNEMEELSRWKGKKLNPNKYQLGVVEKYKVERLDKVGGELVDIMSLTSLEVVESSRIYGRSSLSRSGKAIRLLEKKSKALASVALEERFEAPVEFVPQPSPVQIHPSLWEVGVVTHGKGKSSVPFPKQTSSFYESNRTIAKRFSNSHFPETANLVNGLVVEFFDCLKDHITLGGKNEELSRQKETAEKNFNDLTSELKNVREELEIAKAAAKLEEQKRRESEEIVANRITTWPRSRRKLSWQSTTRLSNMSPILSRVEENGDSLTAEFWPEIKLAWEWDEVGRVILPPKLELEFVAVDEEVEVPKEVEVADNVQTEEVDQQHQVMTELDQLVLCLLVSLSLELYPLRTFVFCF
ncbi:hypothetical protein SLEP1_g6454 [Rubroshorea leprosula]|uniref:Uncharacterized protein n=1 Tax=Rubroshorea leprosula TaxID=152421 RepID=A0AAV5HZU5_9ROSI|nr:hypothetical protein SLEP1_g6454 [Rubroshorea leprosula]